MKLETKVRKASKDIDVLKERETSTCIAFQGVKNLSMADLVGVQEYIQFWLADRADVLAIIKPTDKVAEVLKKLGILMTRTELLELLEKSKAKDRLTWNKNG